MKKQSKVHQRSSRKLARTTAPARRRGTQGRLWRKRARMSPWWVLLLLPLRLMETSVSFSKEKGDWRLEWSPGRGTPAGVGASPLMERQERTLTVSLR